MFVRMRSRSEVEQAAAPVAYSTRSLTDLYRLSPSSAILPMALTLIAMICEVAVHVRQVIYRERMSR